VLYILRSWEEIGDASPLANKPLALFIALQSHSSCIHLSSRVKRNGIKVKGDFVLAIEKKLLKKPKMSQSILWCFFLFVIAQSFAGPIGRPYTVITERHFVKVGGCIGACNVYQYSELLWDVCERCDSKFEVPTDGSPWLSISCA